MIEQISSRLRQERKRLGFANQAQLAERLEISPSSVHNYESGKRSPDASFLAAFAQLGADVAFIIEGRTSSNQLAQDEQRLLEAYRGMDSRGKAGVLAMIAGLTQPPGSTFQISGSVGQVVQGDATFTGKVEITPIKSTTNKDPKKN